MTGPVFPDTPQGLVEEVAYLRAKATTLRAELTAEVEAHARTRAEFATAIEGASRGAKLGAALASLGLPSDPRALIAEVEWRRENLLHDITFARRQREKLELGIDVLVRIVEENTKERS